MGGNLGGLPPMLARLGGLPQPGGVGEWIPPHGLSRLVRDASAGEKKLLSGYFVMSLSIYLISIGNLDP